jgi:hypothetical protein
MTWALDHSIAMSGKISPGRKPGAFFMRGASGNEQQGIVHVYSGDEEAPLPGRPVFSISVVCCASSLSAGVVARQLLAQLSLAVWAGNDVVRFVRMRKH